MLRDDLSANLVHLTRGETDEAAAQSFLDILSSRTLLGSKRDIRGGYKCVCFTETPIAKLASVLASPEQIEMRYKPFGVMVAKKWLFSKGARPVIYQPESEFELLAEQQRFRHVRYELGKVDYAWEREWRFPAVSLDLDPDEITFIVPTRAWEKWALQRHANAQRPLNMALQGMLPSKPIPWHFAVLEDLGVPIKSAPPPFL